MKEWTLLPFTKSFNDKAEWLQDLLLDQSAVQQYRELKFFPKRGESCANQFGKRCFYYGTCNLTSHAEDYVDLEPGQTAETVDFQFKLSDLVSQQKENIYA